MKCFSAHVTLTLHLLTDATPPDQAFCLTWWRHLVSSSSTGSASCLFHSFQYCHLDIYIYIKRRTSFQAVKDLFKKEAGHIYCCNAYSLLQHIRNVLVWFYILVAFKVISGQTIQNGVIGVSWSGNLKGHIKTDTDLR